ERGDLPLYLRGAAPPAPATSRPLGRARSTTGQTRHADHPLPVAKRWNKPPGCVSPALTVLAITWKVILTHGGVICPLCDERERAPGRLTTWTSATATSGRRGQRERPGTGRIIHQTTPHGGTPAGGEAPHRPAAPGRGHARRRGPLWAGVPALRRVPRRGWGDRRHPGARRCGGAAALHSLLRPVGTRCLPRPDGRPGAGGAGTVVAGVVRQRAGLRRRLGLGAERCWTYAGGRRVLLADASARPGTGR